MASTFSTNLAIELIGTGDQAGTWGVTTNTNLGTLIEQAISGYVTQAVATGTDTTITIPNGATGVARNMYLELTGTGGTNTNLIVPANKKLYFIFNNTSSGQVTVKVSGQTGVSVPNGKKMVLVCNGTDVVNGLNYIADFGTNSFTVTNLTATSGTITNLIATTASISDASATVLRSASATLTHLSATSASITNLSLTSLTISSLSITNVSVASATVSSNLTLSGGTANGVLYLNGSKVATSGSALTFDGTNLTASRGIKTGNDGITVSGFVDGVAVGGYDSIGYAASPGTALAIGGYRAAQWSAIYFYTAGAVQAALSSTGLGIGTASPVSKVHSTGPITQQGGISTGAANATILANSSGQAQLWATGANASTRGTFNFVAARSDLSSSIEVLKCDTSGNLEASGNLGLGVTPSAWSSTLVKAFQIADNGCSISSFTTSNTSNKFLNLNNNAYYDAGGWKYVASSVATSRYELTNGAHAWYTAPSGTADNAITFTQAMTLDASGNLGIGTSSPASRLSLYGASGNSAISFVGSGGSAVGYMGSTSAGNYIIGAAANETFIRSDGVGIAFSANTGSSVQMRLDTSGNLGIGTASPTARVHAFSGTAMKQLTVDGTGAIKSGINFASGGTTYGQIYFDNNAPYDMSVVQQYTTGSLIFGTNSTERARITAGGFFKASNTGTYASSTDDRHELRSDKNDINVLVGTTSTGSSVVNVYSSFPASPNAGAYHFAGVISGSGYQFTVDADGDVKNTNGSYAAISDLKLKQDIEDAASQWDDIKSVRVRKYRFKRTPDAPLQIGVIAQELEQTSPGLVSEDADRDDENNELGTTTKSVKYSILYMKAIKALQEAMARIEQLEAKVAVLESK